MTIHTPGVFALADPSVAEQGEMDFETYSEAGHAWDADAQKWRPVAGARTKGLSEVGAAAYAEHPSTEVLVFKYQLPPSTGCGGKYTWRPGMPPPQLLFDYLDAGGVIECHNVMFERLIWHFVCTRKYGWPSLEPYVGQLRCSMAKARVNAYPGALGNLSEVLKLPTPKDKEGKRLLDKFSVPRNPTKNDPRRRIMPADDPADFARLELYCETDLDAERGASERMQPMSPDELQFWQIDQEINWRGVGIDRDGVRNCMAVLEQALAKYGAEFQAITGLEATQLEAFKGWLSARHQPVRALDEEAVTEALKRPLLPPDVRRALKIRQLIGSASVKKLYAMERQASSDNRLRNLIVHHGARTGRPTGNGPQPLNLPKAGPKLINCGSCQRPSRAAHTHCPWCSAGPNWAAVDLETGTVIKPAWKPEMSDHVLAIMAHRSLELVEWFFGDALLCISGCIRSLLCAAPGCELIASDYSAIEAVVTAMLAGEQWRIDTFRSRKDIYLVSAAKVTGKTYEFYIAYKDEHHTNHPDRQNIGKVGELALGFGGWIGAWRQFDSTNNFSDADVKANIIAWRNESPAVVEMWGGQYRGLPWDRDRRPELFGFEGCAIAAIQNPGQIFEYRGIRFDVRDYEAGRWEQYQGDDGSTYRRQVPGHNGRLIITLLSGRELTYHNVSVQPSNRREDELAITYWTWNSNPKYGAQGWVPMDTFGGRLTENIVQATAHDILRFAIINLRAAGYAVVLHIYDEIVVEVWVGAGSIEEVERIMMILPWWAQGWPIFAAGGWRGFRYRKAD